MAVTTSVEQVTPDLLRLRYLIANVYLLGDADTWVLIDAGMPKGADDIIKTAEERFGSGTAPRAIVMTHGHFDHVGAFPDLFAHWDVPVYAHPRELPHLTGQADYPPPDPSVGRGVMALLSFAYPNKAIDLGSRVQPLPEDGSIPYLPDWRWVATPGHTDGHISLFRESDRCLIVGDAFVTVQQESLYSVVRQDAEIHGPPSYFTPDWDAARQSVAALAALDPAIAATGHGPAMSSDALRQGLARLVQHFDEVAVPDHGRYVPDHQEDDR